MRKVFTLLTVALCTANAWAQSWEFDVPEPQVTKNIVADGKTEYLIFLNDEGTEYFYGQGADWTTRAVAKEDISEALRVRFTPAKQTVIGADSVEVVLDCVRLENWASDRNSITWRAADCDGGKSAWVDGTGRDGDGKWQLNLLGDGKFELTNLNAPGGKFGVAKGRMEWDDALEDYTEATVHQDEYTDFDNRLYFVGCAVTDSVNVYDYDAEPDDDGNYPVKERIVRYIWGDDNLTTWQAYDGSLYSLQLQIMNWYYEVYEDGNDVGYPEYFGDASVEAAIGEVSKVYSKADVTYAELNEAWEKLQDAIAWYSIEYLANVLAGATEDDPLDATEAIVNPDFSDGTTGWNFQLTGGNNHVQGDSHTNGESSVSTFAESWIASAQNKPLDDGGTLTQKVGLPVGRYTLEADIIACSQGSQENSHGTFLFADVDGKVSEVEARTGNNAPERYTIVFDVEKAGYITIGIKLVQPTINWVAVDNFKLTYYGVPTKPWAQVQLGRICNEYAERYDLEDIHAQPQYKQEYAEALEAAQDAFENGGLTDEVYEELGDSVRSKANKLQGSINDYNVFYQRIETLAARVDEMNEKIPACADELSEYYDVLTEAYEAGAWNREQIDEIIDKIGEIIGKYVNPEPGDDVSWLLNNTTFDTDFSGWSTVSGDGWGAPWWGPNHNDDQINLTGTMAEDENVEGGFLPSGNAECWHQKFDMYQKIYNMPAGLFNVTCQAFVRQDDGTTDMAYIYAIMPDGTEVSQPVMGLWDDPSDEKLFENTTWFSDAEQNGKYAPNGMGGANFHFEAGYYKNTFSILLREPGDIQIGIKTNSTHLWVLFDNFKITYEGTGARAYLSVLEEEIEKVETKAGDDITEGCYQAVTAVLQKAQELVDNIDASTEEDCVAMLEELKAQHAVISENLSLQEQVMNMSEAVENAWELAQEASAEVKARYEAVDDAVNNKGYFVMSNDELKALLKEISAVLTLVRMPADYSEASDATPVDFSGIIDNPRFHSVDDYAEYYLDDYVTIEVDDETGEEIRTYNEPSATGNYTFGYWKGRTFGTGGGEAANCGEVWNYSAFDAYMEFAGLPEGTYELSCDGFYRYGGGSETSAAILAGTQKATSFAYLYATSSEGTYSKLLNNIAIPQITQAQFNEMGFSGGTSTTNGYVYPGQLRSADCYFKAGLYPKNTVVCKVAADGILRIGIKKDGAVGADWVVVDNFQLLYFGGESQQATSGDDATGIENVQTSAPKAVFTLSGVRVQKANKPGLYIVDGKKVMVK